MINRLKYVISPDKTYILRYEDNSIEVSGEEILVMFHRKAMMDKTLSDLMDDLDTPEKYIPYDDIDPQFYT